MITEGFWKVILKRKREKGQRISLCPLRNFHSGRTENFRRVARASPSSIFSFLPSPRRNFLSNLICGPLGAQIIHRAKVNLSKRCPTSPRENIPTSPFDESKFTKPRSRGRSLDITRRMKLLSFPKIVIFVTLKQWRVFVASHDFDRLENPWKRRERGYLLVNCKKIDQLRNSIGRGILYRRIYWFVRGVWRNTIPFAYAEKIYSSFWKRLRRVS